MAALWLVVALSACSSGSDGPATGRVPSPSNDPPPIPPVALPAALFTLGDSLSDVGNAAAAVDSLLSLTVDPPTVGLCNPVDVLAAPRPCEDLFYRKSRVSDGPVAVEYLVAHFGLGEFLPSLHVVVDRPTIGTNYAVASATARGQGLADLSNQVDNLLLDHALSLPTGALYVFIIGGNDAIDALQVVLADGPDAAVSSAAIVAAATAEIGENIERVLDAGARRLVVANVPDLASLPAVRAEAMASADESGVLAAASAVTSSFNSALETLLDGIESSGQWPLPEPLELTRFDLRTALTATLNAMGADGRNALEACFDSDTYRDSPTAERIFHPQCAPVASGGPRFSEFAFWDDIHPTRVAHESIGTALIELFPLN